MAKYASWVHGSAVALERTGAPKVTNKPTLISAMGGDPEPFLGSRRFDGDLVDLGGYGGVACLRLAWGARFVALDVGAKDLPKYGNLWCHYPIPTPVIVAGRRAKATHVFLNYESNRIDMIQPTSVHVWDGNRRVFHDDDPKVSATDYNGGIPGTTLDPDQQLSGGLWVADLGSREVFFGMSVSIELRVHAARAAIFEIRSVGIDFEVP